MERLEIYRLFDGAEFDEKLSAIKHCQSKMMEHIEKFSIDLVEIATAKIETALDKRKALVKLDEARHKIYRGEHDKDLKMFLKYRAEYQDLENETDY